MRTLPRAQPCSNHPSRDHSPRAHELLRACCPQASAAPLGSVAQWARFILQLCRKSETTAANSGSSQLRQHNSLLRLILPLAILVADLADLVRLKKENLAKPLIGVDLRRQRRGV